MPIDNDVFINFRKSGLAKRLLEGNANVVAHGDSHEEGQGASVDYEDNSNTLAGWAKMATANWVGLSGVMTSSVTTEGQRIYYGTIYPAGVTTLSPGDTVPDGGDAFTVAHPQCDNLVYQSDYADDTQLIRYQLNEYSGVRGFGYDNTAPNNWFSGRENMRVKIQFWASPNSATDMRIKLSHGGTVYHNAAGYDFSGTGELKSYDIPIENTTGDIELSLNTVSALTGQRVIILDVLWYVDNASGLTFNKFHCEGGAVAANLLSPVSTDPYYDAVGYISDARLKEHMAFLNVPNVHMISIGANDGVSVGTDKWRWQIKGIMNRCNTACTSLGTAPLFVLMGLPAISATGVTQANASAMHDSLKQIQREGTSDIDPRRIAYYSGYNAQGKQYMTRQVTDSLLAPDGVHRSLRGQMLEAQTLWSGLNAIVKG